jgi:hypothetical protein
MSFKFFFQTKVAKSVSKIFLTLLVFFMTERFCRSQTAGFRLDKITSDIVYTPIQSTNASSQPSEKEIQHLLSQPYFFLGSGVQCYAFLSQDQKAVLKLFKHYHNMPISGKIKTMHLPSFLDKHRTKIIEKRDRRLKSIFSSCSLAYDECKEDTGLIYLHLTKTDHLCKKLTIVDKIGIKYEIDLDSTEFLLQKKAEMLTPTLDRFIENKDISAAQECIDSLLTLIIKRCKQGISNHDLRIQRNFGYIGHHAIEIDIGSLKKIDSRKRPYAYKKELFKEVSKFKRWLKTSYPELIPFVNEQLNFYMANEG